MKTKTMKLLNDDTFTLKYKMYREYLVLCMELLFSKLCIDSESKISILQNLLLSNEAILKIFKAF